MTFTKKLGSWASAKTHFITTFRIADRWLCYWGSGFLGHEVGMSPMNRSGQTHWTSSENQQLHMVKQGQWNKHSNGSQQESVLHRSISFYLYMHRLHCNISWKYIYTHYISNVQVCALAVDVHHTFEFNHFKLIN